MNIVRKATWTQQAWLWGMAIIAIIIDQYTKAQIIQNLPEKYMSRQPIAAWSEVFQYIHVHNTGAAFSMLEGYGWVFSLVAFGVTGFLLLYNYTTTGDHLVLRIALGSIMGGALGNVIDRIRLGHVTDFIHFNLRPLVADYPALDYQILNWPVFNWADIFVVSGVITMSVLMLLDKVPEEEINSPATNNNKPDLSPVPVRYDHPVPDSYPAQVVYSAPTPPQNDPAVTPQQETEDELARFALWALIVAGVLLALWLVFALVSWQRNRGRRHTQTP